MAADDGAGAAAPTGGPHKIACARSGRRSCVDPEETVLAAILRSGAGVVFGCRGGGCGICKMRLISGAVEHGRCSAAVLPEEERRSGCVPVLSGPADL